MRYLLLMEPPLILSDDGRALCALVQAGRRAAALDGRHLLFWGLMASGVLALQYVAEVGDWLPSDMLWLWQPAALLGFAISIFTMRRGAGRRLGHPVARTYAAAFALAGVTLLVFMIVTGAGARPAGLLSTMIVTATLGSAFLAMGLLTPLRWMAVPGLGWLALTAFYLAQKAVIPADWLRLSFAFAILLALPGAILVAREPR
jgi:hypothetical protein